MFVIIYYFAYIQNKEKIIFFMNKTSYLYNNNGVIPKVPGLIPSGTVSIKGIFSNENF